MAKTRVTAKWYAKNYKEKVDIELWKNRIITLTRNEIMKKIKDKPKGW